MGKLSLRESGSRLSGPPPRPPWRPPAPHGATWRGLRDAAPLCLPRAGCTPGPPPPPAPHPGPRPQGWRSRKSSQSEATAPGGAPGSITVVRASRKRLVSSGPSALHSAQRARGPVAQKPHGCHRPGCQRPLPGDSSPPGGPLGTSSGVCNSLCAGVSFLAPAQGLLLRRGLAIFQALPSGLSPAPTLASPLQHPPSRSREIAPSSWGPLA